MAGCVSDEVWRDDFWREEPDALRGRLAARVPMGPDSQLLLAERYPAIATSAWLHAETWWYLARNRPATATQVALCSHRDLSAEQVCFATRFRSQRARRALLTTNYLTEADVVALLRPVPGKPLAETICNTAWVDPDVQLGVSAALSPEGVAAWLGGQAANFDTASVVDLLAHRFGEPSRYWPGSRIAGHLARALDNPGRAIAMLAHRDCGDMLATAVANTTAVADPDVASAVVRWAGVHDRDGAVIGTLLENPWTHRVAEASMAVVTLRSRSRRPVTGPAQQLSGPDLALVARWANGPKDGPGARDGTPNVAVLLGLLANPNYVGAADVPHHFAMLTHCEGWDPGSDSEVGATFARLGVHPPMGWQRDRIEITDRYVELEVRSAAEKHQLPLPRSMPSGGVMALRWLDTWREHPNANPGAWLDVTADRNVDGNWLACLAAGWALGDNVAAWEALLDALPATTTLGEIAGRAARAQPCAAHHARLREIRGALARPPSSPRPPKPPVSEEQRRRLRYDPLATFPAAEHEALAFARFVADEVAATGTCSWDETGTTQGRAIARLVGVMLGWPIRTHHFPPWPGLPTVWVEDARPQGQIGVSTDAARDEERQRRTVEYVIALRTPS